MITGHDFTQKYEKIRDGIIFNVTKILSCKTKYLGFKTYTCQKCSNVKSVLFSCKKAGFVLLVAKSRQIIGLVKPLMFCLKPFGNISLLLCQIRYGQYFG